MKAYICEKPGIIKLVDEGKPAVMESTDAIIRMVKTTICGTDLHIIKGGTPRVPQYTTLGYEGIGAVESVGSNANNFKIGDKVIVSYISSCGKCHYYKRGIYAHCKNGGGWILGHLVDGTQAECAEVSFADNLSYYVPTSLSGEALVMFSDVLSIGYEIGTLKGKMRPGSIVAIIGAGPARLASLLTIQFYSPSEIIMIDLDDHRLTTAKKSGATCIVNPSHANEVIQQVKNINHRGVDIVIEVVGIPATFDLCQKLTGIDGTTADVGIHGLPVQFDIEELWTKDINITTGLASANTTEELLEALKSKIIQPEQLVTHYNKLNDIENAYDLSRNATDHKAIKSLVEDGVAE